MRQWCDGRRSTAGNASSRRCRCGACGRSTRPGRSSRAPTAKNSGIIFDTWHYVRGGRNDALLKEIPPGVFDTVQIADATLECPPGRTMLHDTLLHRLPIGEGELPNLEILKILAEAGHVASVGPEIFSAELDKLSGDQVMARIVPGFEDLLAGLGAGRGLELGGS